MSKYNDTLLTTAGQSLATRAANGNAKFAITRAVGSKTDLSGETDADLAALTALPDEAQEAQIIAEVDDPEGSAGITGTQVTFQNKNENSTIDEGYQLNTIGLFAKEDGSDKEILYALTTADEADYIPDFADNVFYKFTITIYVVVGQKANVTVSIDVTGTASIDYVNQAVAKAVGNIDLTPLANKSADNNFTGANTFNKVITMNGGTVATTGDINTAISGIPKTDLSAYDTSKQVNAKIAAIPKPDLSGYVTLAALQTILADYIKVDPNTGYVDHTIKVHYGNLLIDEDVVGVNKWVLDEDTAIAQTALYPANNYYVSDDTTTGGAS